MSNRLSDSADASLADNDDNDDAEFGLYWMYWHDTPKWPTLMLSTRNDTKTMFFYANERRDNDDWCQQKKNGREKKDQICFSMRRKKELNEKKKLIKH